jgi:pimeloyl-ACP methyl ester carboxylesterase
MIGRDTPCHSPGTGNDERPSEQDQQTTLRDLLFFHRQVRLQNSAGQKPVKQWRTPMQPATQYAKSGDVHIAYQLFGSGPINLIMVPGFVSNVENYWDEPDLARFLNRLGSYARVVTFDKRGTGMSDRGVELPGLDQRMDDLRAVMDAAGMEQAALFGISEGAPLSVLFAATYPDRCRALALYGSFSRFSYWFPTKEALEVFFGYVEQAWGTAAAYRNSRLRAQMTPPSNAGGAGTSGLAPARPP